MKNLIIYFLCYLLINCASSKKSNYLEIYYLVPNLSTPYSYDCSKITIDKLNNEIFFKKVDDSLLFDEFITQFNKYQPLDDSSGIDVRIKVLVNYNNKNADTLCLGEHFNTYVNGIKMKDNPEMLRLIKKTIEYEKTIPNFIKMKSDRSGNALD